MRGPSRFRLPSSNACKGNHEVLSDTAEFYRYLDSTSHAEFLYECVQQAVQHDLVEEVALLRAYDAFVTGVDALVDMPQAWALATVPALCYKALAPREVRRAFHRGGKGLRRG